MKQGRTADIRALLARYPKTRPALQPRLQEIYAAQYKENRAGGTPAASLSQRLESWLHRRVADDVVGGRIAKTLELGAGTLNQLPFEPPSPAYDIVEPFVELYAGSPLRDRVRDAFADITETPLERRYDRITGIASFEHMCDLPFVLGRAARLLKPDGVLRAAIPSEGGLLWRLGWSLTTGLEFRLRHGLDYGELMRHEHVNEAWEVEALIGALFEDVRIRTFGIGRQFSLYRFIAASRPRLDVAAEWDRVFGPKT